MEIYSSENEQIDALRRWWEKNGRLVVIALVLVLAAVIGWQSWQRHQRAAAIAASAEYEAFTNALRSGAKQADEMGRAIIAQYPDTAYASLSHLALAGQAVDKGELDAAQAHLAWVKQNAPLPELKALAQLREARVELSRGNAKGALELVEGVKASGLDGYLAETRGDILLALGKKAGARAAYQQALAQYAAVPSKQPIVSRKLDDLATAEEPAK